jgi:hypothetical protein
MRWVGALLAIGILGAVLATSSLEGDRTVKRSPVKAPSFETLKSQGDTFYKSIFW